MIEATETYRTTGRYSELEGLSSSKPRLHGSNKVAGHYVCFKSAESFALYTIEHTVFRAYPLFPPGVAHGLELDPCRVYTNLIKVKKPEEQWEK